MAKNFYPLYTAGRLDPQSEEILKQIDESNGKPLASQTIKEARDGFFVKSWLGKPAENINISNLEIEGSGGKIPLHIYTPAGGGQFPVLLFFHGGGFVVGMLDEFDAFCSYLADGAGCVVVSVGYRLAPENKYPAQVEDAASVLEWLAVNAKKINGDPSRISVIGDSAGGNLAAVVSIIAREKKIKILMQVLICPWLNLNSFDTESYKFFGEGAWLSAKSIYWFKNHYLQNEAQAGSYLVSPGLLLELSGLPPALIIAAEFDVLCSEGRNFAARLKEAGVQVKYSRYDGMLHDFITLPGLFDKSKTAIKEICEALKVAFNN